MNKDDLNPDFDESNNYFDEEIDETEREAIELLKSQHEQIKNLKGLLENKDNMINVYKEKTNALAEKLKYFQDNFESAEKMKNQFNSLLEEKEHLRSALYQKEKLTEELQNEFNDINNKFKILNDQILHQEDSNSKVSQLVELVKQYSKELTEITHKNKLYESELNNLNKQMSDIMKENQSLNIDKKNFDMEFNDFCISTNKNINLLCQWIDNYLGVYYDKKIEIPDIPILSNFNNKISFDILRQKIYSIRNKIYEQQLNSETAIQKYKQEQIDLLTKIEKLNKEISFIKNQNLEMKEGMTKFNISYEQLNDKLNQKQVDFCSKNKDIISYIYKLNNRILKLKQNNPKYKSLKENIDIETSKNTFEDNVNSLLENIIECENKIEYLKASQNNLVSKDELNTVKQFYQSRIETLENELQKHFDTIQLYKDDNCKLVSQLQNLEREKNAILQDNIALINERQCY